MEDFMSVISVLPIFRVSRSENAAIHLVSKEIIYAKFENST